MSRTCTSALWRFSRKPSPRSCLPPPAPPRAASAPAAAAGPAAASPPAVYRGLDGVRRRFRGV
eukprot:1182965-Prorocentrum_minimum.AAC.1